MTVGKTHIVSLSGGKNSTCLALRLAEVEPRPYVYLCTPTGYELPEMEEHWARLETLLGQPLTRITNGTLRDSVERNRALPTWRMRFCTRELKIQPALAFAAGHSPAILYAGLRADEPLREGIFDASAEMRFPLREWGWGLTEVIGYLRERGIRIPRRTDCDRCPYQRLSEWEALYWNHPDRYADAEAWEKRYGHTFRSPGRDSKPAALSELKMHFAQPPLASDEEWACDDYAPDACRLCRL